MPGLQGPAGPPGPAGESGPPGPEGGAYQRDYVIAVPAQVWEVSHELTRQPNVTSYTHGGDRIEGDVTFPTPAIVRVFWHMPMTGLLRLT
ncbi:hypothetical protein ETD86_30100 [Nonomuraea turkmeniaca]|uniref:Collagen-like protein n=1 Tax=Nonomuraea turkmeniaca TaxID=103838 RepID=A0A5S4FA67_9ACTN|nr:hypothetical protein ETD86_30100 [Nonomuraea turkmeniaca]